MAVLVNRQLNHGPNDNSAPALLLDSEHAYYGSSKATQSNPACVLGIGLVIFAIVPGFSLQIALVDRSKQHLCEPDGLLCTLCNKIISRQRTWS